MMSEIQKTRTGKPLISILVPVFNEEGNVRLLHQRLISVTESLDERYDFEFIFTDNHSTDATFDILRELAVEDSRIRAFRFSKNFGFQRSILTGFHKARGAAAIQIDCDLQDPPEMFADFLDRFEEGYDVVYGIRRFRGEEGLLMRGTRGAFYRFIDALSEDSLPHDAGDFRLVSRRVIEALKQIDDYHPYLRGLIASLGFRQTGIEYDRASRKHGESKFTLRQLFSLAMDGILNHSIVPLRMASLTAFLMSVITLVGILFYLIGNFVFGQQWPAGFATTTVLLLFSITLNALFLGIIGEYLGRIYQQVKKRPLTIIETTINESTEFTDDKANE